MKVVKNRFLNYTIIIDPFILEKEYNNFVELNIKNSLIKDFIILIEEPIFLKSHDNNFFQIICAYSIENINNLLNIEYLGDRKDILGRGKINMDFIQKLICEKKILNFLLFSKILKKKIIAELY